MSETELIRRVEKLERDNRRLKGFGLATLVLATALATIYATQPVPQKITAHEFNVVDNSGRVRVRMHTFATVPPQIPDESEIGVYDAQGRSAVHIIAGPGGPSVILFAPTSEAPQVGVRIHADSSGEPSIGLFDAKGKAYLGVGQSGLPSLTLSDPQGFEMDLGSTQTQKLVTGATEQTSAASIVMFGNDEKHRVIWKAP